MMYPPPPPLDELPLRGAWCLLLFMMTLGAASANAQVPDGVDESNASETDQEARNQFEAGRLAFEDGRFEDALSDFTRSFELSQRAELLFNIGTTLDRLRRPTLAVEAFERYLSEVPQASNARAVRARIALIRAEGDAPSAPIAPPRSSRP